MATYVLSDIHGHHRALDQLLGEISPASEDDLWVLGDMIDRGPDPVEVMRTVHGLSNAHVLMGNHEELMLDYLLGEGADPTAAINWGMNGGGMTEEGLARLPGDEAADLVEWVHSLPLAAHIEVQGRPYVLAHAGIRTYTFADRESRAWSDASLEALLGCQTAEDLLWIREPFWGQPTGLLDAEGKGPIVISGHTPVPYVEPIADVIDRPARNEDGLCQMLRVGATEKTGGVADRWAIDCGCAGGAGWGRLLAVRVDDGAEFYADIKEGE